MENAQRGRAFRSAFHPWTTQVMSADGSGAMVGAVLGGRWKLVRLLAEGGMGVVWIGEHADLAQPVAIKLLHFEDTHAAPDAEELLARFALEGKIAARLARRTRHIVPAIDCGIDGPCAYLVFELVEGETLDAAIGRQGRLPPRDVSCMVGHVARGLRVAHEAGVVHRDLKPSNVMISRDEDGAPFVRILDFGVARARQFAGGTRHQTRRGMVVGTPWYMSPEQARGQAIDPRFDVWALAACAFEAMTGMPLVDAETPRDAIARVAQLDLTLLRPDRAPLSPSIDAVFQTAFARLVDRRFRDVLAFARAFDEAIDERSSPADTTGRRRRRRLAPAVLPLATTMMGCPSSDDDVDAP
jgi:serine/threonine protein kinase